MSASAASIITLQGMPVPDGKGAYFPLEAQILPTLAEADQTAITVSWSTNWYLFQARARLSRPGLNIKDLMAAWVEEGKSSEDIRWPEIQAELELHRLSSRSLYGEKSRRP